MVKVINVAQRTLKSLGKITIRFLVRNRRKQEREKQMNKTSTVIYGWVLLASFAYAGYLYGQHSAEAENKTQLQKVINWNTKQIHSLGVTAATDKHNAELLIQILNKIEGNPVKSVEKYIPLGDIVSTDPIVEDNDVPLTFEQVFKDQREVDQSIRAFAGANLFQAETLHNILGKIKEPIDK